MSNTKPLKHLWLYGESKNQKQFFSKRPNILNHTVEEAYLFDAKAEYLSQKKELTVLQAEQKRQNKICEERIVVIRKLQDSLREKFEPMNNVLQQAGEKMKTAIDKTKKQIELQNQLNLEIAKKREENTELLEFSQKLQSTVNDYEIYEKIMGEAVVKSKTFESVDDMMNRCEAIMVARHDIVHMNHRLLEGLVHMKNQLVMDMKKASTFILGLINQLGNSAHDYEKAKLQVKHWERIYKKTSLENSSIIRDRNSSRNVILWMCHLLRRRIRPMPEIARFSVETQLDFIRAEVILLREVVDECHRRQSRKSIAINKYK